MDKPVLWQAFRNLFNVLVDLKEEPNFNIVLIIFFDGLYLVEFLEITEVKSGMSLENIVAVGQKSLTNKLIF